MKIAKGSGGDIRKNHARVIVRLSDGKERPGRISKPRWDAIVKHIRREDAS